jgi:glycosyltransferase involved in cell wall biosynthesis
MAPLFAQPKHSEQPESAKRVVFFLQGERVPAARARGLAILPALARAGFSCETRIPYPSVYGDTRFPWPLNRPRPLYMPWSFLNRCGQLRDLRGDDLIVFQRPMTELPTLALERWAARGRRTVLDFDDSIFLTPPALRKFRRLVGMVDHVIAGNSYLAEMAGVPEKTTVIPTVVDTNRFCEMPSREGRGNEVVLGWTGSAVGYQYLVAVAPGIAAALKRTGARFRVIADRPPPRELAPLRPEFVRWNPQSEIADLAEIDIGLMPLGDGPQERGKCAYKLIQYMAIGRAAVASPVGANRQVVTSGVDGFFASDAGSWEEVLVRLIDEPALRRQIGIRARRRIIDAYSVDAVIPSYVKVLRALMGPR